MSNDLIITIQHLHTVPTWTGRTGYCHKACRGFFDRHGWDWSAFLQDGIPAQQLIDTGDALALAVVEHAKQLQEAEHGHGK